MSDKFVDFYWDLGSTNTYFALKLSGHDPSSEPMQRAKAAILAHGGADAVNSYARFYLALLGQISYDHCPAVPPEAVRDSMQKDGASESAIDTTLEMYESWHTGTFEVAEARHGCGRDTPALEVEQRCDDPPGECRRAQAQLVVIGVHHDHGVAGLPESRQLARYLSQ